jgi:hypothetical protein
MRAAARLDGTGFIFIGFLLALMLIFHMGYERAASDGRSYFIELRSMVMDRDFDLANEEAVFGGLGSSKYPIGAAILWSPVYLLCHAWLHGLNALGGDWSTDGYTFPYQRSIGLASLWYGFVGLILIYRVLRAYFSRAIATLSTLGICTTTFLVWYITVDNSMVHGLSMFATTLFLFLWHRFRAAPTPMRWFWLGASAGIMASVRWQDGVFLLLPVADLLWVSWRARRNQPNSRVSLAVRDLMYFGVAAFVTFLPQFIFWKSVFGQWIYLPTREHGFGPGFVPPFIVDVLFSSNHGLLTSTPIIWLSVIGLLFFARRDWRVAAALGGGLLAQIWINGAVEIWWGGVGYGARRFADSMLVFAVGLAAMLSTMQRFPLVAPAMILSCFLTYNVVYMQGFHDGTLPSGEGVTFQAIVNRFYERVGNPFSFPVGAYVAWRYDVKPTMYDVARGRTYSNVYIDVGGENDERFLGHGWNAAETNPQFTFRWADAKTASILVPLKADLADYALELDWAPFTAPGLPPQVVGLEINDAPLPPITMRPGLHMDRVTIPKRLLRPNLNHLRLRFTYVTSPKEAGVSDDDRPLAVQVTEIRFLRQRETD